MPTEKTGLVHYKESPIGANRGDQGIGSIRKLLPVPLSAFQVQLEQNH